MSHKFSVTPADFYFRKKKWRTDSFGTKLLHSAAMDPTLAQNNAPATTTVTIGAAQAQHNEQQVAEEQQEKPIEFKRDKRDSVESSSITATSAGYPVAPLGALSELDEEVLKLSHSFTEISRPAPPIQKAQSSFLAFKKLNHVPSEEIPMVETRKSDGLFRRAYLSIKFPSVRVLFTLVTSVILITTVSIMILFTVLRGQSLQLTLAAATTTSITQRASFFLTELLGSSLIMAFERNHFIQLNQETFGNIDLMVRNMYTSLERCPTYVSQIYQASSDGHFIMAGRENQTNINEFDSWIYFVNETTGPGAFTRWNYLKIKDCDPYNFSCSFYDASHPNSVSIYDPRMRPWFEIATQGVSLWTDIYFFQRTGLPGITGVDTFYEGGVIKYVSAVDLSLESIGIFLRQLSLNMQSSRVTFIVNRTSHLIACGGPDDFILTSCEHIDGRNLTNNATISWIVESHRLFNYSTINSTSFETANGIFFAALPYSYKGISWIIVAVIEQTDSSSSYFTMVAIVAPVVGVALLFAAITLTYFATKRLTTSLKGVTKKLLSVSNLEVDPTARIIEVRSIIKEVNDIENATTTLIYGLRSFSKYVPQEIVKLLIKAKREANLGLDEAEISIFFSDIANFTTISETLTPRELVALLGEYLMEMSDIVQCTGGLVDKYIGDAVMAFWNAPNPIARHELAACEAALLSQSRLAELREKWIANGFPKVEARIGIHSSKSRVGNVGSSTRFNYTCIGDGVNLASRLEGLNKVYGTSILVSGTVYDKVSEFMLMRLLDVVAVKGKSKAVRIYELIKKSHMATPEEEANCRLFKRAFETYLKREFQEALEIFQEFLKAVPGDEAAELHIRKCQKFIKNPPPRSWTGVAKIEEK